MFNPIFQLLSSFKNTFFKASVKKALENFNKNQLSSVYPENGKVHTYKKNCAQVSTTVA